MYYELIRCWKSRQFSMEYYDKVRLCRCTIYNDLLRQCARYEVLTFLYYLDANLVYKCIAGELSIRNHSISSDHTKNYSNRK